MPGRMLFIRLYFKDIWAAHMTHNQYSISKVANIIQSDSIFSDSESYIQFLVTDSRRIIDASTSLFLHYRESKTGILLFQRFMY